MELRWNMTLRSRTLEYWAPPGDHKYCGYLERRIDDLLEEIRRLKIASAEVEPPEAV